MKPTVQECLSKLEALGSADQIALFLEEQGIKGTHNSGSCPVANYVMREIGESVRVNPRSTRVVDDLQYTVSDHPNPGPVVDFVRKFDDDHYRNLEIKDPW